MKQQQFKNINLTNQELIVLISAIYDSLFTEEELQNSILEDLQELLPEKERNKDKEMLSKSKERTKILEELKERFNQLTWEF